MREFQPIRAGRPWGPTCSCRPNSEGRCWPPGGAHQFHRHIFQVENHRPCSLVTRSNPSSTDAARPTTTPAPELPTSCHLSSRNPQPFDIRITRPRPQTGPALTQHLRSQHTSRGKAKGGVGHWADYGTHQSTSAATGRLSRKPWFPSFCWTRWSVAQYRPMSLGPTCPRAKRASLPGARFDLPTLL